MDESLNNRHGTSDEYYDPYCDLCFEGKGRNHKARGYCLECVQFLCSACNDVHGQLQATRRHTVLRGEDMPKSQSAKPPRFEDCEIHSKHINDQFCFEHQILLCSVCSSSNHNNCTVMSVDDACKFISTSDVDLLYDKIKDIKTRLETVLSGFDSNTKSLEKNRESILEEAKKQHHRIVSKADELFQMLKNDIDLKYKACLSDLERENKQLKEIVSRLDKVLDGIEKEKDKTIDSKAFLRLQDALNCKESCKNEIENLKRPLNYVSLALETSEELQNFFTSSYTMGTVSTFEATSDVAFSFPDIYFPAQPHKPSAAKSLPTLIEPSEQHDPEKPQKMGTYRIKLEEDNRGCLITSLAVAKDGRKLMVDRHNHKVKLFSKDMNALSSVSFSSQPLNLTMIGDHEAVVSVKQNTIVRIKISDSKIIKQKIRLSFEPHGITKYKDKLIVTAPFDRPPSVNLIDLGGKVIWSATTDEQGLTMFDKPCYVSSFDDQSISCVIVTDTWKNAVTLLNGDTGQIIARGQLKGKAPIDLTTDTAGNIYVCCSCSAEVAVLSRDLSKERTLFSSQDLIDSPAAIAYDDKANQLIISYRFKDHVEIYQL